MGLAASQARFLGLTARKANCEYKSTDLAQQKLNITNQLAAISNDYSNAMNATKLIWSNETVADIDLNYNLLMMPSAANDYNPYLVTTKSGSVILNNEFAAAAKAAGISKCGGFGSQEQRDKFIAALSGAGIITKQTAQAITKDDYNDVKYVNGAIELGSAKVGSTGAKTWNPFAGVGAEPMDKSTVNAMQLTDLIMSETFGQMQIDWNALIKSDVDKYNEGKNDADKITAISTMEYENELKRFNSLVSAVSRNNIVGNNAIVAQLQADLRNFEAANTANKDKDEYKKKVAEFEEWIAYARSGKVPDNITSEADISAKTKEYTEAISSQIIFDRDKYKSDYSKNHKTFIMDGLFNTSGNKLEQNYNIMVNNLKVSSTGNLSELTIGDLLAQDITIVCNKEIYNKDVKDSKDQEDTKAFAKDLENLFKSITRVFGFSPDEDLSGRGLNLDEASKKALSFAYDMTIRQFSKVTSIGGNTDKSLTSNSAFLYSSQYNTICTDTDSKYAAVNLSNMLSSFLTYYDNYLSGLNSSYLVSKSVAESIFVTDNPDYYYIAQDDEELANITNVDRNADFYDQLYNNILAHGWREDVSITDSEYLESALKDGRYSLSSLNEDGYYYQTRYNQVKYMVEVSDTDAIARAEAEFTAKKAELTYKEDSIDIKSKNLDAEIAALNTEYDSVKNLIQKGIDIAFKLYQ